MTPEGSFEPTMMFFWLNKLTGNILDHDEQNPVRSHQHWKSGKLH